MWRRRRPRTTDPAVPVRAAATGRCDTTDDTTLLEVVDLRVEFETAGGLVHAVNGISYTLVRGETLAIVGESGSGKTAAARALLDLIPSPPGRIAADRLYFDGIDLLALKPSQRRRIAGAQIGMVFQDPLAALNPVFTVGRQIDEALAIHSRSSRGERREIVVDLLAKVGIPAPATRLDDYPHQFSGGMRQRILIAMAIALHPTLLIADEPTSALDVTVQAQILDLLSSIQRETSMALLLITHDLGIVGEIANRVSVMYAGRIMELGPAREVLDTPAHPYTRALAASQPRLAEAGKPLRVIGGAPPDPTVISPGCPFVARCEIAGERCATERPPLTPVTAARLSACHYAKEVLADG